MSAIDPLRKRILRWGWRNLQSLLVFSSVRKQAIKVWYGGARSGDLGGPLVKVKRLQQFFPEFRFGFSIVYLLSNTPYLTSFSIKFLKWRGIPIILNQNGVFYSGWFDGDWQAKNKEMAKAWHVADYAFCQSQFCYDCARQFLGARKGPVEILYNAVDVNHFRPIERNITKPVFLVAGKIDDHMYYRLEATLRGFGAALDNGLEATLTVAGWMSETVTDKAVSLARELDIIDLVSFTGAYSQEEAPSVYQQADVYVMLKHNDPCPNTVLEAMASGLAILYSDSGGVPELASGNCGISLPVQQGFEANYVPEQMEIAKGMKQILKDLPARQLAARQRAVAQFDIKKWIERHQQIFCELSGN